MTIADLERERRLANISIQKLARTTGIDRRRLGYILDGLTPDEVSRIKEALLAASIETAMRAEVRRAYGA